MVMKGSPLLPSYDYCKRVKVDKINWLISEKIDGIRCLITEPRMHLSQTRRALNGYHTVHTANGKPVPNKAIRSMLSKLTEGFDGELAPQTGLRSADCMKRTVSEVMTIERASTNWKFYIFNYRGNNSPEFNKKPFSDRMILAEQELDRCTKACPELEPYVTIIPFTNCESLDIAVDIADQLCSKGAEGAMLTHKQAPYLNKRCSNKTPHLLKLKGMQDFEARIVRFEYAIYSHGETVPKALRGTEKAELGSLVLEPIEGNSFGFTEQFHCGTGFSQAERVHMADNFAESYKGKIATIKFMQAGNDARPRQPVWRGLRTDVPTPDNQLINI